MKHVSGRGISEASRRSSERQEAVDASIRGLEREGWRVLPAAGVQGIPGNSGPRLIAGNCTHAFRVLVVLPEEIDSPGTRAQISNSAKRGETRVFVAWPTRWRMISNLERWGIPGVAVNVW